MKFCQPHWTALREMVIEKGMGALIVSAGVDAPSRALIDLLKDTETRDDPLMTSYWALSGRALAIGGLYLMGVRPGDGGEYCPMCEVEEQGLRFESRPGAAQAWMEGCTDSVLVYCRENNLLPRAQ